MKLIIAILRDSDSDPVTQALTAAKFRVTRIASTGGLLRRGTATLLIGVEDDRVDAAIQLLREKTPASAPDQKRATLFVVPVDKFVQI
ncbi:MAG: cyclic-di-AMP receptor [Anaerolineales bacterium]|nr:cyclic-di-AMP receptor [Anaerolineales bacterium]MDO9347979.1 cyclic-di-AMP receptor [Anaerolineales bacterium]